MRRALAISPNLGAESLPALFEEKKILINRSGAIEFISDSTNIGAVGGLEESQEMADGAAQAVSAARFA